MPSFLRISKIDADGEPVSALKEALRLLKELDKRQPSIVAPYLYSKVNKQAAIGRSLEEDKAVGSILEGRVPLQDEIAVKWLYVHFMPQARSAADAVPLSELNESIAKQFGISRRHVRDIRNLKVWRHLI